MRAAISRATMVVLGISCIAAGWRLYDTMARLDAERSTLAASEDDSSTESSLTPVAEALLWFGGITVICAFLPVDQMHRLLFRPARLDPIGSAVTHEKVSRIRAEASAAARDETARSERDVRGSHRST